MDMETWRSQYVANQWDIFWGDLGRDLGGCYGGYYWPLVAFTLAYIGFWIGFKVARRMKSAPKQQTATADDGISDQVVAICS